MDGKEDGLSKAALELISPKWWPVLFTLTHWCFAVQMNLLVTMWPLFPRERVLNFTWQLVKIRVCLNALLSSPPWVHRLGNALPSAWIFGLPAWSRQTWMHSVLYSLITHIPIHWELLTHFALNQWSLQCAKCGACDYEPLLDHGWIVKQSRKDVWTEWILGIFCGLHKAARP